MANEDGRTTDNLVSVLSLLASLVPLRPSWAHLGVLLGPFSIILQLQSDQPTVVRDQDTPDSTVFLVAPPPTTADTGIWKVELTGISGNATWDVKGTAVRIQEETGMSVYSSMRIEIISATIPNRAKIFFQVRKVYVNRHSDKQLELWRQDGGTGEWKHVAATRYDESQGYVHYHATFPGFSEFAIVAVNRSVDPSTTADNQPPTPTPTPTQVTNYTLTTIASPSKGGSVTPQELGVMRWAPWWW